MRANRSQPAGGLPQAAAGAMRWLRRGKPVLPLRHRSKEPAVVGGLHAASDKRMVLRTHAAEHPHANYGLLTGRVSDLLVLDVDGPAGEASLRALERTHRRLPKTIEVRTARGRHIYLALDGRAARSSVGRLGSGLDVRADGSYVVAAGSLHPSGHRYAYVSGRGLDDLAAPTPAPAWLVAVINQRPTSATNAAAAPAATDAEPSSQRSAAYAAAAVTGELGRLRQARPGHRNAALNTAAYKIGRLGGGGGLDVGAARAQLIEAGRAIGLAPDEVARTVESGLGAGLVQPRRIPRAEADGGGQSMSDTAPSAADPLAAALAALGETDADNADRFARRHRDAVAYVPGRGVLAYDAGVWRPGGDTLALRLAEETARAIAAEAAHLNGSGDKTRREAWVRHSLSKPALERMVGLAKGRLEVPGEAFDAQPWLLCVANGTLDLRTGQLRPHDPADRLTRRAAVAHDPKATCPLFRQFLHDSLGGDREAIAFVQRAVGMSLTGDVSGQVLFYLKGCGRSGKSTLANLLRELLGGYACHTGVETFTVKRHEPIPADLARLDGMRLVTAGEINHIQQFDEARVKGMTGGDPITARHLYGQPFEYRPQFTLWLYANEFPKVRATDEAFWRRIRVIPFDVAVPEGRIDRELPAKLRAEGPGILNWALAGCRAWQREGLEPPRAVREATAQWRHGADHVRRWLRERTGTAAGARTPAAALHADFRTWCEEAGEKVLGMAGLKARLLELGHRSEKTRQGNFWVGLRLRD
ncbi:putative DNA primase/helicase [Methylorubrum rhodinum]|uniref:Putative DNA primase/helicase n=1 Tax=Methylorubrum rhodinum TaxID=29428 RepID=A0A840ZPJ9_9HYPH|nr:phage/plasmid primase, P4 family [Methylorubrum rhodinum]MBB5760029.1 putative DNA primase/helicase [Methylorubrum rhodinum]